MPTTLVMAGADDLEPEAISVSRHARNSICGLALILAAGCGPTTPRPRHRRRPP